ncbi:hypothetical protein N7522_006285 [Penicillium canescens]|nr:hypothetical protein N7522_006285 [Penicillium canescens]
MCAMKRSASPLDEAAGCGVVVPTTTHPGSPLHIPHDHYALIYIDDRGKVQTRESQSIQEQGTSLFTPEVIWNFGGILNENLHLSETAHRCTELSTSRGKRPKREASAKSAFKNPLEKVDSNSLGVTNDSIPLRIGDTKNVMAYYRRSLERFQQLNCREVAKAFIKLIEPRKQVKHPYCGKAPIGSQPASAIIQRGQKKEQALPTTVVGPPSTQVYSPPGLFSTSKHFMSEVNGGTERSLYNMLAQCQTAFTQPTLGRPTNSKMTSSHDAHIFNYSVRSPCPASTYNFQLTSPAVNNTFYQDASIPTGHGLPEQSEFEFFNLYPTTI